MCGGCRGLQRKNKSYERKTAGQLFVDGCRPRLTLHENIFQIHCKTWQDV
jgi:hypothetical protein